MVVCVCVFGRGWGVPGVLVKTDYLQQISSFLRMVDSSASAMTQSTLNPHSDVHMPCVSLLIFLIIIIIEPFMPINFKTHVKTGSIIIYPNYND